MSREQQTTEFIPCPFCGSADVYPLASFIKCGNCDTEGPPAVGASAAEKWNTRAGFSAKQATELLRALVAEFEHEHRGQAIDTFDIERFLEWAARRPVRVTAAQEKNDV